MEVSAVARFLRLAVAFSFLSAFSAARTAETRPPPGAESTATITVRIYNYARVPNKTLDRAQRKATRILRHAGIETAWQEGPLSQAEIDGNSAFQQGPGLAGLALRVLPRSMSEGLGVPSTCFGFAQMSGAARFPSVASVFFHRVQELAGDRVADLRMMLGHVMAHEIGHQLLGEKGHSRSGIMSVPWKRPHLQLAAVGHLRFTDEEAARMRANVRERVQWEEAR